MRNSLGRHRCCLAHFLHASRAKTVLKMHAQMFTINAALSAVANASDQDVKKIIATLESESIGFACATETVEGPFEVLDLALLQELGLNAKQLAVVQIAQGQSGR